MNMVVQANDSSSLRVVTEIYHSTFQVIEEYSLTFPFLHCCSSSDSSCSSSESDTATMDYTHTNTQKTGQNACGRTAHYQGGGKNTSTRVSFMTGKIISSDSVLHTKLLLSLCHNGSFPDLSFYHCFQQ